MDTVKCMELKRQLAGKPEPQLVPIGRFFDGNDDPASIGCNLLEHPGVEAFRTSLSGLLTRPDVKAVYACIAELDPGEDSWPFTDTVLVLGSISAEELADLLASLEPDEVSYVSDDSAWSTASEVAGSSALIAWWD